MTSKLNSFIFKGFFVLIAVTALTVDAYASSGQCFSLDGEYRVDFVPKPRKSKRGRIYGNRWEINVYSAAASKIAEKERAIATARYGWAYSDLGDKHLMMTLENEEVLKVNVASLETINRCRVETGEGLVTLKEHALSIPVACQFYFNSRKFAPDACDPISPLE